MMLNSRYIFDNSSKKFICPNCSKKRFVRYIDTITENYLPEHFGKCDRSDNCNYHNKPNKAKLGYLVKFLQLKKITSKATKIVDENGTIHIIPNSQILETTKDGLFISDWFLNQKKIPYSNGDFKNFNSNNETFVNTIINKPTTIKEPSFHSLEIIDDLYCNNPVLGNLEAFLLTRYTKDQVFKAKQDYFLTGSNVKWNNSTIFWQIDENEIVRAGKIMLYDPINGKRIKKPYNHINWIHRAYEIKDFNLNQCLFGLQSIREDYSKPIGITESEKTAIVMSIEEPSKIWLATGSKQNFKEELMKPIKNRDVTMYPDKGEYNKWLSIAKELNNEGFNIKTSKCLEDLDIPNGNDIADLMLK